MANRTQNIIIVRNEDGARNLLDRIAGKSPAFVCVGGTTETAKIPGISMAGKEPELTSYTPAADLEILLHGKPKSMDGVPVTPQGIPTPALLTLSALQLGGMSPLAMNAGMKVRPRIPAIEVGGKPGGDIRGENAVLNPREAFHNARLVGEALGKAVEYLVIGETIPGGTTTALGVLRAMGVDAEGMISSSMPENPHDLKNEVVEEGLKASGLKPGSLEGHPMEAIRLMGDPMVPAVAGLAAGSAEHVPVILAGGTQMASILNILEARASGMLENVLLGTTSWIIQDRDSDLEGLVDQISDAPILAADLDFSEAKFDGLRAYQEGYVKEGVGAGGAAIAAMLRKDAVDAPTLLEKVEKNYEILVR